MEQEARSRRPGTGDQGQIKMAPKGKIGVPSMAKKLCNATGCDMEVRGCDIPHLQESAKSQVEVSCRVLELI